LAEGVLVQGRYLLRGRLGRGGMGEVWQARDQALDRDVAVKCLHPGLLDREESAAATVRERFRREARAAARLQHPGITVVHDFGDDGGVLYLVMELLVGKDLGRVLDELPGRRMDVAGAVRAAAGVAAALAYTHGRDVVHRDLKPANVIRLDADGSVKICDFGIARLGGEIGLTRRAPAGMGGVIGSPHYMSPEQIAGEELDHRTDLYSLGCVLHELLSGAPPFDGGDPWVTMLRHRDDPPVPLRAVRADIPPELDRLVLSLLAKRPEDRPADAREVLRALSGPAGAQASRAAGELPPVPGSVASPASAPGAVLSTAAPTVGAPGPTAEVAERAHPEAETRVTPQPEGVPDSPLRTATPDAPALPRWAEAAGLRGDGPRAAELRAARPERATDTAGLPGLPTPPLAAPPPGAARAPGPAPEGAAAPDSVPGLDPSAGSAAAIGPTPARAPTPPTLGAEPVPTAAPARERMPATPVPPSEAGLGAELPERHPGPGAGEGHDDAAPEPAAGPGASVQSPGEAAPAERRRRPRVGDAVPDAVPDADAVAVAATGMSRAGRWEEAYQLHQRAAALRARSLGPLHPDTLASRHEAAFALTRTGRFDEALAAHRALAVSRARALGPDHPDTLCSRQEAAFTLARLARWEEADADYRRVLDDRLRLHGADHPDTLRCRHNLGVNLGRLGRVQDALREITAAAEGRTRVLGPDHPDTLATRHELGCCLGRAERWEEALAVFRAVAAARARVLGAEDPETVAARHETAIALGRLRRCAEAVEEYRAVAETRAAALGPAHPETLRARHGLGVNLGRLGRWEEALAEARAVGRARAEVLGAEHPDRLLSLREEANALGRLGRWDEALECYRAVADARERALGARARATVDALGEYARCLEKLGLTGHAAEVHRRAAGGPTPARGT